MEASDFLISKLHEYIRTLSPEEIKLLVLGHPDIIRCDIVTYQEFENMRKVRGLESDHAAEL